LLIEVFTAMEYFYLKLGVANEEAEARLTKTPPDAAVFFDNCNERDYENGKGKPQARLFWERSKKHNRAETVMIVIRRGQIWFLKPTDKVEFSPSYDHPSGARLTTKTMPVEILKRSFCKDVPPVLAGIGSSQHHGRRTFTKIQHWGNLKAIDCVLGWPVGNASTEEHWDLKKQCSAQLLECLGSTELETLVGKLFEAHGCHVPAYLGGTLSDIDIFAHNDTDRRIKIGQIKIAPRERISIQVKTWSGLTCPEAVDYLIGLDAIPGPKTFDAAWLLARVKECASVLAWMKRSLNWLPQELLHKFEL
jgi:hypothetical protein